MDNRELMIDEIIDRFNFEKVLIAMQALDWRWQSTEGNGLAVPSLQKMKSIARHLLRESIKSKVVSTGGFEATYYPAEDKDSDFFELKFILCHARSYND